MNKKIQYIFEKIESEKSQNLIKKLNGFISIISIVFIFRISTEHNLSKLKINELYFFIVVIQLVFLASVYKIWKNFLLNNKVETNSSILNNWSQANLNKYIPGGIGITITKFSISKNLSKDSKKIFFGMVEDQLRAAVLVLPFIIFSGVTNNIQFKILIYIFLFILTLYGCSIFSKRYSEKLKFSSIFQKNLTLIIISSLLNITVNYLILYSFVDIETVSLIYISILYFVSSSIGLIFIGSPAGIGIRESIFYFLSLNFLARELFFSYILISRFVSIFSDIFFFIIAKLKTKLEEKKLN